ncbi:YbaB/EbfC family nucleoid-associated protein [Nonomuraea roseola]|uniref:YbaB/EbfC family nucleoid-associated protein n=1 Tax=Nonomuraea roseola TaxID=46179 RepID=A0ABV5Q742_9ACTN
MTYGDAMGAGGEGDVRGLLRQVEGWVDAVAGTLRQLDEQKVTGTDSAERVVATVSGAGRLLEVRIDGRSMRDLDHVVIARAVLEAIGAAREIMADNLGVAMSALNGGQIDPDPGHDPLDQYFDAVLRETDHG